MQRGILKKEYFEKDGTDTFTKRKWIMLNVSQKFRITKKEQIQRGLLEFFLLVIIVSFLLLAVSESIRWTC